MDKTTTLAILRAPQVLESSTSYADALTHCIRRNVHKIDGYEFFHTGEHMAEYVHTGRHTLVFRLGGSKKTYRVMIEPIDETHKP